VILDPVAAPERGGTARGFAAGATGWPPPYEGMVMAAAGEPASAGWAPSQSQLDYAHKGLQVVFLTLALVGLLVLLREGSLKSVLRERAHNPHA
jgi:hypothetical protein